MSDRLTNQQRRALQTLAGVPRGVTEALMLAHGFATDMLAGLVLAGLATVVTDTVQAGGRMMKVERFLVTDAGRRAIGQ